MSKYNCFLSEDIVDSLVENILALGEEDSCPFNGFNILSNQSVKFPGELKDLQGVLERFPLGDPIEIYSHLRMRESCFGDFETEYIDGPIYEGKGILIGEKPVLNSLEKHNFLKTGFKIWALSFDKIGFHFFSLTSKTSGRILGLGYGGSEETDFIYQTPFRRVVGVDKEGLSLEKEIKEGTNSFILENNKYF